MDRTKNTLRNAIWGFVQKIVTILLPFTTRTLLIKMLGAEYLGISGLFTSVLSILSLAELGVSTAIVSSMYKPIAENDTDTICALMAFYKKAYRIIGIVILTVGLLITPFLPKIIKGDIPSDVNIYILYIIYLGNTSVSYFLFAYKNCLFAAHQRNDRTTSVVVFVTLLQYLIQIVLLVTLRNYYCYTIVIPVCSILRNVFVAILANKEYPKYVCRGSLDKAVKTDLKKRVLGLMLGKITSTIRSSVDSIFVSMFLGLTAVAMYSNYMYILTSVMGIIQLLESSMVAGVGNSIATGTVEKNHRDFEKFTFMLQWAVGWCSICILCLIQLFMNIWVGKEYMFNESMAFICAGYLFVFCISMIRSIYTQATGMWWQLKYLSIIDLFVNIALNYFFVKYFGAYGIMFATIIDIVFVSIPWTTYYLFRDYFGMKLYRKYIFCYLKYFILAVVAGLPTYFICRIVNVDNNWLDLLIKCVICIAVPNVIYLLLLFKNKYFRDTIRFIKYSVLKRGKA